MSDSIIVVVVVVVAINVIVVFNVFVTIVFVVVLCCLGFFGESGGCGVWWRSFLFVFWSLGGTARHPR